jgi:hypothetical protein
LEAFVAYLPLAPIVCLVRKPMERDHLLITRRMGCRDSTACLLIFGIDGFAEHEAGVDHG